MKKSLLCLALIYISTSNIHANAIHPCDDNSWTTYKDEKCFKLFNQFETHHQAEEVCNQQGSKLVEIKSADEQKFLIEYVFNSSNSNDVWIGAKRRLDSRTEFLWNDDSPIDRFANWAIGHPSDVVSRLCVLMQSVLAKNVYQMEWKDVACNNGYWFVCEKLQLWPFQQLQQATMSNSRDLQWSVEQLKDLMKDMKNTLTAQASQLHTITNQITDTRNDLANQGTQLNSHTNLITETRNTLTTQGTQVRLLQANPVPIGFIYFQLPNQPEPRNIWGTVSWTEVTSQYAGLFFRAQGGGSEAFGNIQEENSPRLEGVSHGNLYPGTARGGITVHANNVFSAYITSGAAWKERHLGLSFRVSSGEVRPRNQAIRIWRRNQ